MLVNNEGSTIFEFGNKFVIGVLTKATEEGNSTFEDAKTSVELAVRKEKKAKVLAEKLKNAASGQSDMESIASKLGTPLKQASGVNFSSYSIPSVGFEPAVIGAVCNLPSGKVSAPIEGNEGVYLAKVTDFTTSSNTDLKGEKMRLAQTLGYRAGSQIFEALKKGVEIEDKRSKFY
jgi:peptidyl-prolyl cis-trans isomerase D